MKVEINSDIVCLLLFCVCTEFCEFGNVLRVHIFSSFILLLLLSFSFLLFVFCRRFVSSFLWCFSIYWIINAQHWCVQPLPHPCAGNERSHCFVSLHFCQFFVWTVWTHIHTHTRSIHNMMVSVHMYCAALRSYRKRVECRRKFLSMMQRGFKMLINNSIGSTMGYRRCCRHMKNTKPTELESGEYAEWRECVCVCV